MRVSDLLRMSTGHQTEPAARRRAVDEDVPRAPGAVQAGHPLPLQHVGTYMQSAIVQKATGQTVLDYLKPRLFEPLGIENPTWEASPQGISPAATA
jgi:CubicO group peptidase (beta-lactamase class C family)